MSRTSLLINQGLGVVHSTCRARRGPRAALVPNAQALRGILNLELFCPPLPHLCVRWPIIEIYQVFLAGT